MSDAPQRVVFDCNIFVQAMLSVRGPAHACWQRALNDDIALIISAPILAEIRKLPNQPGLRRFKTLTPWRVERFISEVLGVATLFADAPAIFAYTRDPDDAHYVNLALAANAR